MSTQTGAVEYRGPLCGDPSCEICPTQEAIDAWLRQLEENARQIVAYYLGRQP